MPYLFVKNYETELMNMNKSLYHIFIESVGKSGGERDIAQMRIHQNGLPLTLVENYSKMGKLHAETEARDIKTVEEQLQKLAEYHLAGLMYVCRCTL